MQEESVAYVVQKIAECLKLEQSGGPSHLFVISTYTIGKERILSAVRSSGDSALYFIQSLPALQQQGGRGYCTHEEAKLRRNLSDYLPRSIAAAGCEALRPEDRMHGEKDGNAAVPGDGRSGIIRGAFLGVCERERERKRERER